ncbi:hypothetical protein C0L75_03115 [Clostridium perfringens]
MKKDIINKDELLKKLNNVVNDQDKFIAMAIFYGILGTDAKDLINLKVSDIDFEKNIIRIGNRTIIMEDDFKKIIQAAINQKFYLVNSDNDHCLNDYEFNENSEYVIKVKPMKNTQNGLGKISTKGLKKRLETVSESIGFKLTTRNLITSGAIYRILLEGEKNSEGKYILKTVEDILKKYGYVLSAYRIYKIINDFES